MNIALGESGLVLALLGALAGAAFLSLGTLGGRPSMVRGGQSYIWLVVAGVVIAAFAMQRALITHDFTLTYVDNNDATFTPLVYRVTAMWSALAGSILLWALILVGYLAAMWYRFRNRRDEPLVIWAKVTGYVVAAFFIGLMVAVSNPFQHVHGAVPTQGPGPDPLLQDRLLVAFHPPLLYLGLVGFTVPFCLAVGSLVTGQGAAAWLQESRRWAIFAWAFLSAGIILGMWWSYQVLGWGGYWSWDPVENTALLPWLTSTAFLHSALVEQRRGMLRVWNLSLLLATFSLTVLGTFFTRSGVLESVHSFTSGGYVGPYLLGFFGIVVPASIGLLAWRGDQLHNSGDIFTPISREGAFLANNFLFTAFAFVVLLGTVFPLVVEAANGSTITVGGPFFDQMTMPLILCLLFLMAVAPVLPWRRASAKLMRHRLAWPAAGAAAVLMVCLVAGLRGLWPLVIFTLAAFAGWSALRELVLMVRRNGLAGLAGRSGGGMVAHLGIVAIAVAIAASHAYQHQDQVSLSPGQTASFAGHRFQYVGLRELNETSRSIIEAVVKLDGTSYYPAIESFPLSNTAIPSPAIRTTAAQDIYLTLAGTPTRAGGPVSIGIIIEPLVVWLWTGGLVLVLGSALALLPPRRRPPASREAAGGSRAPAEERPLAGSEVVGAGAGARP